MQGVVEGGLRLGVVMLVGEQRPPSCQLSVVHPRGALYKDNVMREACDSPALRDCATILPSSERCLTRGGTQIQSSFMKKEFDQMCDYHHFGFFFFSHTFEVELSKLIFVSDTWCLKRVAIARCLTNGGGVFGAGA